VPAVVAAVLGLLATLVPALFALLALAFSGGQSGGGEWLVVAVPLLLAVLLPVGAVLLLLGRSWLLLAATAGVLTAIVGYAYANGAWGDPTFGVLTLGVPAATAALAALPGVRRWVAARRRSRSVPSP
jgi:hypothetical protein